MTAGAVYIAYGEASREEARRAILQLVKYSSLPIIVIGESVPGAHHIMPFDDRDSKGRWAKLNLYKLSPFSMTLYMDADTLVKQDIDRIFCPVHEGFDMAIAPSTSQGSKWLWHLSDEERSETVSGVALQGGVFVFGRSPRLEAFFEEWKRQWLQWQGPDQGAMLRALWKVPLKLWLLGSPWNGGAIIGHNFSNKGKHLWKDYRKRLDEGTHRHLRVEKFLDSGPVGSPSDTVQ